MIKTCRNPDCPRPSFDAPRADAQYCSHACRTAAYRKRAAPLPDTLWLGKRASFSASANGRGLSNAELADRLVELSESEDGGKPKTGRRFWYLALSHGYVNPGMGDSASAKAEREAANERILKILVTLRKQGRLPWGAVLDLTRELDQWQTYGSPREARAAMRRSYTEDRWLGQPCYPVLIVEKDTLEPVCKPLAAAWQMPFASSRGYSSLTLQHDVATMLCHRFARTGQGAVIYFVSDLDPSGLDLQRAWKEALRNFGAPVVEFVRGGLNLAQVRNPALDIERLGIGVKPSDSRSRAIVADYGRICWEADILPAAEIEAALDGQIESWLDAGLWNRRNDEIEVARRLL